MHAVSPIDNCPHLQESLKISEHQIKMLPCHACDDASENWICLHCGTISCSRYVKGHAAAHNEESKHNVSLSFSDLSVWCYSCESYIKHPSLVNVIKYLSGIKFYGDEYLKSQSETLEEFIKPSFLDKWEQFCNTSAALQTTPQNISELIDLMKKVGKLRESSITNLVGFFETQISDEFRASFFGTTLPGIVKLVLEYPRLFPEPLPILSQNKDATLKLNRLQIASLLSVSFLCMWDLHNFRYFPKRNFTELYSNLGSPWEVMKMQAIIQYFTVITQRDPKVLESEHLLFHRQAIQTDQFPSWETSASPISDLQIQKGSIEDSVGYLQADFANKYIGGGVISGGCVQEEIRFAENTELIASCLFVPVILDNEAVILTGSEQFCTHKGYAFSLVYGGPVVDTIPKYEGDKSSIIATQIVAMDATDYRYASAKAQYLKEGFVRELNKAYVSFFSNDDPISPIATGNWGCGAFLGDRQHKFIIQLLAASQTKRTLGYSCFGDVQFETDLVNIHSKIKEKNLTVGKLYSSLVEYQALKENDSNVPFFEFLLEFLHKI